MLKDGIILSYENGKMVFNQRSFCELISYYVGVSYEESSQIVSNSHLAAAISGATAVILLSHEYPYYWAMSAYYGHAYWEKGIPAQPDDLGAYVELEDKIIEEFDLCVPFEFDCD